MQATLKNMSINQLRRIDQRIGLITDPYGKTKAYGVLTQTIQEELEEIGYETSRALASYGYLCYRDDPIAYEPTSDSYVGI